MIPAMQAGRALQEQDKDTGLNIANRKLSTKE
jgi:hypothetical protein